LKGAHIYFVSIKTELEWGDWIPPILNWGGEIHKGIGFEEKAFTKDSRGSRESKLGGGDFSGREKKLLIKETSRLHHSA